MTDGSTPSTRVLVAVTSDGAAKLIVGSSVAMICWTRANRA